MKAAGGRELDRRRLEVSTAIKSVGRGGRGCGAPEVTATFDLTVQPAE